MWLSGKRNALNCFKGVCKILELSNLIKTDIHVSNKLTNRNGTKT